MSGPLIGWKVKTPNQVQSSIFFLKSLCGLAFKSSGKTWGEMPVGKKYMCKDLQEEIFKGNGL